MSGSLDLSTLSPDQLAQIPAGIPPNGTVPNLLNPSTSGYNVVIVTSLLTAMMLGFVCTRFYVIFKIKRKMAPDDWAALASAIGAVYYFVVVCISVHYLKFGTHLWDLSVLHLQDPKLPKMSFLSNAPAFVIFSMIKTTFFLMYLQIFRPLVWLRRCAYAGLVVTWCFYIAVGATQLAFTLPSPGQSWTDNFASPRYLKSIHLCVPISSFSLALDSFILLLPIIAISHLQLNRAKKFGAAAMFSTGLVCCVASSLAVYFQYRIWKNQNDYTYWVVFVLLAYSIEMCVGISTSCMPSIALLHKHRKSKGNQPTTFISATGSSMNRILRTNTVFMTSSSKSVDEHPLKSPYSHIDEPQTETYEMDDRNNSRRNNIK